MKLLCVHVYISLFVYLSILDMEIQYYKCRKYFMGNGGFNYAFKDSIGMDDRKEKCSRCQETGVEGMRASKERE